MGLLFGKYWILLRGPAICREQPDGCYFLDYFIVYCSSAYRGDQRAIKKGAAT